MSYQLGVDVGTTYTSAAVRRPGADEAEVVPLGTRSASAPSVAFVAEDGSLEVGEAAERRALTDTDRVVRGFKRRIGEGAPPSVHGDPIAAETLAARMVRWAADLVADREGEAPSTVVVTYPAGWGSHQRELFAEALGAEGLADALPVAEPEAAALACASERPVDSGETIAVYDLGGGVFDAAVVRKTAEGGFELLARPEGLERVGGEDFDAAVFARVTAEVGDQWDVTDPELPAALARLRRECREAKEALSAATEVTVSAKTPGVAAWVRLGRAELEEMIRPAVEETVDLLGQAVESAGHTADDLSAVLLAGGSCRIPLVGELVSARLGRSVAVDIAPKAALAVGAALAPGHETAAPEGSGALVGALLLPEPSPEQGTRLPQLIGQRPLGADSTPTTEFPPLGVDEGRARSLRMRTAALAGAAGVVLAGGVALLVGGTLPGGPGSPSQDNVAAGGARPSRDAAPGMAIDPWTGQSKTPTTQTGPRRPETRPAADSAAGVAPAGVRGRAEGDSGGGNRTDRGGWNSSGGGSSNDTGGGSGGGSDSGDPTDDPATDDPATDDPATDDPATDDPSNTSSPSLSSTSPSSQATEGGE